VSAKAKAQAKAQSPFSLADLAVKPGKPLGDAELPSVAIIILNYNGLELLAPCFESLRVLDYPQGKREVFVIDNGSVDGSPQWLASQPVRLHRNPRNVGFAAGCNQGAELASAADVLVFLNNDVRCEAAFLRELVAPIARGECAATTAKMLTWDGRQVDSAGGGMNYHGLGLQYGYHCAPGPEHDLPRRTLFACGGAMAVSAATFRAVGRFDEEFFAYYEDVDLGWRMWVQGHEVHYVPSAVCYHRHSGTTRRFPSETVRLLQVRNPLLSCVKNYDDQNLRAVLPAALAVALRRMHLVAGIDPTPLRIEEVAPRSGLGGFLEKLVRTGRKHRPATLPVRSLAAADLVGINDWLGNWNHWWSRRQEVQSRRARSDEEVFRLFLKPLWCVEKEPASRELHDGLLQLFGLRDLFAGWHLPGPDPND
jgi:GT2 family glycosyltransferase